MTAPRATDDDGAKASGTKGLLELFGIIAFYLYFGGWTYTNAYWTTLGIGQLGVDTPTTYFLVFAYNVFFGSWKMLALIAAIGVALFVLGRFRLPVWAALLLVLGVGTAPFPVIYARARAAGEAAANQLRAGNARLVTITPRSDAEKKYPASLMKLFKSGKMYLVMATKDRYVVMIQPQPDPAAPNELPIATVYDFPTADFLLGIDLPNAVQKGAK